MIDKMCSRGILELVNSAKYKKDCNDFFFSIIRLLIIFVVGIVSIILKYVENRFILTNIIILKSTITNLNQIGPNRPFRSFHS